MKVSDGGLVMKNTSNIDKPVIDVQSDSEFACLNCNITNQNGLLIKVKDSFLHLCNSTLSNMTFSLDDQNLIKVQSSIFWMNGTTLSNIAADANIPFLSIIKVRESSIGIEKTKVSRFTSTLISAIDSELIVNRSVFEEATNNKVNGLVFNLEESNMDIK